jgi:hypothetical protein
MVDFDDGYGDPSDYGMEQSDFDAASAVGAQTYQDNQDNQNQQFGIGSGDGIDSSEGNIRDPSIGFGNDTYRQFSDDMLQNYLRAGSVNPYSSLNALNNFAGGAGDFGINGSRMGLNTALANLYTKERGASNINPFPEGPFGTDTIFGKVDRTKDLGSQRIQEINDLRARQAFGLPSLNTGKSYTSKDFEAGRDTQQGMVQELPMGGIERFARAFTPYGAMLPTRAAPVQSQMYRDAQTEADAPGIIDQVGDGLSSYGTDVYNSVSETGGAIGDFLTNMITKSNSYMNDKFSGSNLNSGVFSAGDSSKNQLVPDGTREQLVPNNFIESPPTDKRITTNAGDAFSSEVIPQNYSPASVGIDQLGSMNSDGQYGDAAGSLFKRNSLDNYTSPNFTQAEIENKYNKMFGPQETATTDAPRLRPNNLDTTYIPRPGFLQTADMSDRLQQLGDEFNNYVGPNGKEVFGNPNLRLNFGLDKDNNPEGKLTYNTNFFG